ncbi:MAG TPA: 5-(carboxyamino)imidazole ribonucleotide mutase [Candidatus Paceibacterota bacterium]|nr:5-(carboxyamino)imidazole ribonucleotide mutase [Candidatus Paceibacterota bacterium]
MKSKAKVGIIMGSDSDLPIMKESAEILESLGVAYEISIVSAHRTPDYLYKYGNSAQKKGISVIIAGAGGSAHLPGMTASMTTLPVIGVPIKTKSMDGLDSLLSIAQMPPGVPVATVAVNGAKNAGLLAAQILATSDAKLSKKLSIFKQKMNKEVMTKSLKLTKGGYAKYLNK